MKILIFSLILVLFKSSQSGVLKNLMETVANEVNKTAGYIENVANKSDMQLTDDAIDITKAEQDRTKHSATTKVIITEQNGTNILNSNQKNNTQLQVNVDITLVVNYNIPNTNQNYTLKEKKKNAIGVTDASVNIEESSINVAAIDVQKVNTKVKFPGPMNSPIVTYNEGVVVVETNTTDDKVLFPDSNINIKPACPDGTILTENGYCIIDKAEKDEQTNVDIGINRSAFSGACLQNYGRALDGSCQQIIED